MDAIQDITMAFINSIIYKFAMDTLKDTLVPSDYDNKTRMIQWIIVNFV